jgi:hypothetical protein
VTRTQIQLTEDQYSRLKDLSRESRLSLSELVRKAVDQMLAQRASPRRQALSILGAFRADRRDVSTHHDRHFPDGGSRERGLR